MKGITIKVGRVKRGLTQTSLATKLGLSQTEVSKLERGIYLASKETANKIRNIFRDIDEHANERPNI